MQTIVVYNLTLVTSKNVLTTRFVKKADMIWNSSCHTNLIKALASRVVCKTETIVILRYQKTIIIVSGCSMLDWEIAAVWTVFQTATSSPIFHRHILDRLGYPGTFALMTGHYKFAKV